MASWYVAWTFAPFVTLSVPLPLPPMTIDLASIFEPASVTLIVPVPCSSLAV